MPSFGGPAASLVLLTALVGGGVLLLHFWKPLKEWLHRLLGRLVDSTKGGKDGGAPGPLPSDSKGSTGSKGSKDSASSYLTPSCPYGPDGSGHCASDSDPPVPDVPLPAGCDVSLEDVRRHMQSQSQWSKWPIVGQLHSIATNQYADNSPSAQVQKELNDANDGFRAGNELYLNSYAQVDAEALSVVGPLVAGVLGPGGLIVLSSELAGLQASQSVYELLPVTLALCIITLLLVWAV